LNCVEVNEMEVALFDKNVRFGNATNWLGQLVRVDVVAYAEKK